MLYDRHHTNTTGQFGIAVVAANGRPRPARIFITGEDGRAYAPDDTWMHADENFVRSERPFEAHYFHSTGNSELTLPAGTAEADVMKGFEYGAEKKRELITPGRCSNLTIYPKPISLPKES